MQIGFDLKDWYINTGDQALVAPVKLEESDGLQAPENWMKLEMNENLWSPEKYLTNKSLSNEVRFRGIDDIDDIPLSYLVEDLKTHAFSPTLALDYWDKKDDVSSSDCVQFNLGIKDCPSIKPPTENVTVSPSEQKTDEISMEESVLLELQTVMDQMTARTRLCFRDALYLLARNSKGSDVLHVHDNAIRSSRRTETQESETSIIDRAIANLMFNNKKSSSNDQKTSHFTRPFIISGNDW